MRRIRTTIRQPYLTRRNHLFRYDKNAPLNLPLKPLPDNMELIFPARFNEVTPAMLAGGDVEYNGILERTRMGDTLGIVIRDNLIVHRSIVQMSGMAAMEGDHTAFLLKKGEYYIHWCETMEGCSGLGLYSTMLRTILVNLNEKSGFQRVFIACRQDNIASIKGVLKAGFVYNQSSKAISILGGLFHKSFWYHHSPPPELKPGRGYAL